MKNRTLQLLRVLSLGFTLLIFLPLGCGNQTGSMGIPPNSTTEDTIDSSSNATPCGPGTIANRNVCVPCPKQSVCCPENFTLMDDDACHQIADVCIDFSLPVELCQSQPAVTIPTPIDDVGSVDDFEIETILPATYQVFGFDDSDPTVSFFASAFAISDTQLATNAHVTLPLAGILGRTEGRALVVQHETGTVREIVRVYAHPDYNDISSTSPDVGVIETVEMLPSWMPLASRSEYEDLQILDPVTICGFPGDVSIAIDFVNFELGDIFRPRATCFSGTLSSLRPFDPSQPATATNTQLVQLAVPTTQGTSGSPVISELGTVIAIHSSGTIDVAGTNRFSVRIDTLLGLLEMIEAGLVSELDTTPINITGVRPGRWSGTTSQGKMISFRTGDNFATDFRFGYRATNSFCNIDIAEEACIGCTRPMSNCTFGIGWEQNEDNLSSFFVFADSCPDSSGERLSGRISAFPPENQRPINCFAFVSDIPWTAKWIGP